MLLMLHSTSTASVHKHDGVDHMTCFFWEEIEAKDEEIAAAVKKHEDFVETLQKQYEEHAIWRGSPSWLELKYPN